MKKEDLLRKHPELIKGIVEEFVNKVSDNSSGELWQEYLEDTLPEFKHNFKVLRLVNDDYENFYDYQRGIFINKQYISTRIPYVYAISKYRILKVLYNEKVYEVGERVLNNDNISGFKIEEWRLIVILSDMKEIFIEDLHKKVREILFITEDGVKVYEGDSFYYLTGFSREYLEVVSRKASSKEKYSDERKRFSTYESAYDYLIRTSKTLSFNDVEKYLTLQDERYVLEIVKEKIKNND